MSRNGAREERRGGRGKGAIRPWRCLRMRPTLMALEDRRLMSVYQVTNNANSGTGSLPFEISLANANAGANTIEFASNLSGLTITLASDAGSELELTNTSGTQTITGPAGGVTIDASGNNRVFQVGASVTASISGLTIADGDVSGSGGGLYNKGNVTLTNVTVSSSTASGNGGGLYDGGVMTLTNVTLTGNSAGSGGGLQEDNNGTLMLTDCTVSGNTGVFGGGIWLHTGAATMTGDTMSGNHGAYGGGVRNSDGTLTLTNCTLSGNSATSNGAGISNIATTTVINCTVAGNSAAHDGGGIEGTVTLGNTIVATNTASIAGPDADGTVTSKGDNLIGNTSGSSGWTGTDVLNTNPDLGTLANNGGPTQTMALLTGSPAIDAGANSISGLTIPTTDERGALRGSAGPNAGSTVDIGAYEASSSYLVTSTADSTDVGTLRAAVGWANVSTNANPANSPAAPNTIVFNTAGVFATQQTITLTSGQLTLSHTSVAETITGPAAGVTVSGGGASRVFQVDGGVTASISGLTITGGSTTGSGGGLYSLGTATLTDCAISGNSAYSGGGLYNNYGTMTVEDCTLSGNDAQNLGGAIYTFHGSLIVSQSTVAANTAGTSGGGIDARGTTTVTGSTFTANAANGPTGAGGAIDNFGGNFIVTLQDSIFSGDTSVFADPEVSHSLVSLGNNLVSNTVGSTGWIGSDLTGVSADLGTLGDYGGPTDTIPLLPGSPAIGAGTTVNDVTTDQRGLIRGGTVDIGAFQTSLVVESTAGSVNATAAGLTLPGAVSLADQFAGSAITFDPAVFAAPQKTITLAGTQLALSDTALSTSITGPAPGVTVSGGGLSRVFQVDASVTASLSGLTITGGSVTGLGGGVSNSGTLTMTDCTIMGSGASTKGGGLANLSGDTATLIDCTISGNAASAQGGGIESYGLLTLNACDVSGNVAGGGGGVNSQGAASLIAMNTTISGNSASGLGGGLAANSTATLTNCTISGNTAGTGGGILEYVSTMTLTNCTVTDNHATDDAGIYMRFGSLQLSDSTVSANTANAVGGIGNPKTSGSLTIKNTIVSGNSATTGPDIVGTINTDNGYNLFGTALSGTTSGTQGPRA
jgi:hypothetical protein